MSLYGPIWFLYGSYMAHTWFIHFSNLLRFPIAVTDPQDHQKLDIDHIIRIPPYDYQKMRRIFFRYQDILFQNVYIICFIFQNNY